MEYSPMLNPVFLIPTGIVVILDILSFPIYFKWVWSGQIKKSRTILFLKPFSVAICIYFLFTQFGAGFFVGTWYCLITPVITLGMMIYFLLNLFRNNRKANPFYKPDVNSLRIGALIILLTAAPAFLYRPIKNMCSEANSSKIQPISQAIEKYHAQTGKYPREIKQLVPEYISSIPTPACALLSGKPREFGINNCTPPFVWVETVDFMGYDLYASQNGERAQVYSFFDGGPYFCP